jgi:anti-anti-sigma regulatory factor
MVEVKKVTVQGVAVVSVKGELDASSALIFDNAVEVVIAEKPVAIFD